MLWVSQLKNCHSGMAADLSYSPRVSLFAELGMGLKKKLVLQTAQQKCLV